MHALQTAVAAHEPRMEPQQVAAIERGAAASETRAPIFEDYSRRGASGGAGLQQRTDERAREMPSPVDRRADRRSLRYTRY